MKPLYGNGGAAVFRIAPDDTNLDSLVELFQTVFREPFMVQQYRPEVRDGDKRIILVDGEMAGAINRVPQPTRRAPTCTSAARRSRPSSPSATAKSARAWGPS